VLLPQLSQGFATKDYERVNKLLHKVLVFTVTITLPSVAGLSILSTEIMSIAGGSEYAGASNSLRILSIAMALFIASGVFGNMILLPSGREVQFAVVCAVGMLVNAILNLFLIPMFGIEGAAFATVIAALIFWIGTMIKQDKNVHFSGVFRIFVGPLMGAVVIILIGLVVRYLELGLWIGTSLAVLLSVLCYAAIQIITKNEMAEEVLGMIRRKIVNM
jgi:O-antigen/teichoic acid export membrane protein